MKTTALPLGVLALALSSCNNSGQSMDFERMVNQAHYEVYEESEYFPDGRVMREPPEGTVPADRVTGEARVLRGEENGTFVGAIPVPLDRAMLEAGRSRFEILCTPCHGALGDGDAPVAKHMTLRKPPSLVAPPVRDYPVGRIYQVIADGYGLMPSYGEELGVRDRWSVVAYVRALQIAAGVPLGDLPEGVRQRALEELK
jgi:hypothetical protein